MASAKTLGWLVAAPLVTASLVTAQDWPSHDYNYYHPG
jgi:hypothetical protein